MTCGVVATSNSGCDVCTACRVVCNLLPQRHLSYNNVFLLINSKYCSFSKAQHTLPEDGPIGPKHVGANKEIF